jgi:hypothetical protein
MLIAIGVFFLARRTWPELHLLSWLHEYWPVLFIAVGAIKLAERLGPRRGDAPDPAAPAGGFWR